MKAKPVVVLHESEVHSFLSARFAFEHAEGKVGEACPSQLTVSSSAISTSAPVTISELRIEFEGSMKPIIVRHTTELNVQSQGAVVFSQVSLADAVRESRHSQIGEADLTFRPDQKRIFEFNSLLREDGDVNAISASFSITSDQFDFEYVHTFERATSPDVWWGQKGMKKRIARADASALAVLPKPPKMELRFVGLEKQYYTNEPITLRLEVLNEEEVDAIANLDVRLRGEGVPALTLKVTKDPSAASEEDEKGSLPVGNSLPSTPLGTIARAASATVEILVPPLDLPAVYDLAIKASYNLVSDLETPISRSLTMQLEVINPFEANYDFSPRMHPDPWPSLFTHHDPGKDGSDNEACGLGQKWCLTARYASFATEELIVEDVDVEVITVHGGIICSTTKSTEVPAGGLEVGPRGLEEAQFDIYTQKRSLDDRGTATLDVALAIKWRRNIKDAPLTTSTLAVPRLLVSSSEPRVLSTVSYSARIPFMIHFDVTIENPSNHFLTFGVTMEPNEKFAFSGVKQSTLQLVPLSRRTMRFRLLPSIRGDWIGPIQCVIKDRYFQKVLKIAPTEGMKVDKEGILVWVPPDEDI